MTMLAEALTWFELGWTPVPVRTDGTKAPTRSWRAWQHERPTREQVVAAFAVDHDGFGVLTGTAREDGSTLLMVEAEGRAVTEGVVNELAAAMDAAGLRALWGRVTGGYAELTPTAGIHWYVVVEGPCGRNAKLASRSATAVELEENPHAPVRVLLETRGQGGFTVVAPSAGRSHPTGAPWRAIVGTPSSAARISVEELEQLLTVARGLDRMPAPGPVAASLPAPGPTLVVGAPSGALRPGDDFNARASWADILGPHGWTVARTVGSEVHWVRPGKHARDGISATTGHAEDGDRLYVFSTSTEFESERPYDKLGALAVLEHGGDIGAAVKALGAAGYGRSAEADPGDPFATGLAATAPTPRHLHAVPNAAPATDGTSALAPAASSITNIGLARYGATEDGLASALVDAHAHELRYCPQRSSWLAWDGARWQWDEAGRHREFIKGLARHLPDNDSWKAHRKKMLSAAGVGGVAKMASTIPGVVVDLDELDVDPWALNTPGGMVDLRTGGVRATSPDDLCTRLTAVGVDRRAPERWLAFLAETFGDDAAMVSYVQRLAGYSASGAQLEHVLPFLHGAGGNGKSVFLEVLVGVLGDYASTAPPDFLLASARADEAAVARLSGLRLVACSEVNQSARFDEAKVKLLTGGDRLTARFLYGNHFTFTPTHHLWLMGNHQPRVEAGGDSFWRRLRLLPFTRQVPKEKRVEGLAQQLVDAEGPQILGWVIAGAVEALSGKLREPEAVMAATASYAEEEDALGRFVADRVMLAAGARTNTTEVRSAYTAWCRAEGVQELSPQMFGRELRSRWGVETTRSNGRRLYVGMTLYAEPDEDEDDVWSDR